MTDYGHRAAMTSQREKVLLHAEEVVRLLSAGVAVPEIQRRIGLEDMPGSTFYYHVTKLRKAGNIPASAHARQMGSKGKKETASSPVGQLAEQHVEPAPAPAASPQPEREVVEKADEEKPEKRRPRIRKPVQVGMPEPVDESKGFNPAKWKKLDI